MRLKTVLLLFSFLSLIEEKNFEDFEMFLNGESGGGWTWKLEFGEKIEQYSNINKDYLWKHLGMLSLFCGEKKKTIFDFKDSNHGYWWFDFSYAL